MQHRFKNSSAVFSNVTNRLVAPIAPAAHLSYTHLFGSAAFKRHNKHKGNSSQVILSRHNNTSFTVDFWEYHVDVVVVHAGTIGASLLVALQNNTKHKRFSGGNI